MGLLEIEEKDVLKMKTFANFELKSELLLRNETENHIKEPFSNGNGAELVVCVLILL